MAGAGTIGAYAADGEGHRALKGQLLALPYTWAYMSSSSLLFPLRVCGFRGFVSGRFAYKFFRRITPPPPPKCSRGG